MHLVSGLGIQVEPAFGLVMDFRAKAQGVLRRALQLQQGFDFAPVLRVVQFQDQCQMRGNTVVWEWNALLSSIYHKSNCKIVNRPKQFMLQAG